ncbi:outer membrane porin HofQ [compost metagenome]
MQNSESKVVEQVPLLGSIPILGELFKSTKYQKNETELAILVTPKLVSPETKPQTTATKK